MIARNESTLSAEGDKQLSTQWKRRVISQATTFSYYTYHYNNNNNNNNYIFSLKGIRKPFFTTHICFGYKHLQCRFRKQFNPILQ